MRAPLSSVIITSPRNQRRRNAIEISVSFVFGILGIIATFKLFSPSVEGIAESIVDWQHAPMMLARLPRHFSDIGLPLLVLYSAWGVGRQLFSRLDTTSADEAVIAAVSLVLGMAVETLAAVSLGLLKLLYAPIIWTGLIGLALISTIDLYLRMFSCGAIPKFKKPTLRWHFISVATFTAFCAWIALLGAVTPEVQSDGRLYHLADALRYAQHHGVYNLVSADHIFQNGLANYLESTYSLLIVIAGLGPAKATSWAVGMLAWFCLVAFVSDAFRNKFAGLLAGSIFLATPVVTWEMTTESTDLALVPYALVSIWCIFRRVTDKRNRWLLTAGALCGIMFGTKALGAEIGLSLLVIISMQTLRRKLRRIVTPDARMVLEPAIVFSAAGLATASPWIAESIKYTHDPLFPAGLNLFQTPFSFPAVLQGLASQKSQFGDDGPWYGIVSVPWKLTYQITTYRDLIGSVYLCGMPIVGAALLRSRRFDPAYLDTTTLGCLGLLQIYFSGTLEARYITWGLALLSGLIAVAVCDVIDAATTATLRFVVPIVLLCAVLGSTQFFIPLQRDIGNPVIIGREYINWDYLYGTLPEKSLQLQYVPIIAYANTHLPPQSKIYDCANLITFNSYSTAELYNGCSFASPTADGEWSLSQVSAYEELTTNSIGYIAVTREQKNALRTSTLWRHLKFLEAEDTPVLSETVYLYKILGQNLQTDSSD